jgi:hypothetical protein
MASPFSIELTMAESPSDAQARAATALTEPARSVGLRLKKRGTDELEYGPRLKWPRLVALWHNLRGEQMTVKFEPAEAGDPRHEQRRRRARPPRPRRRLRPLVSRRVPPWL